MRSRSHAGRRRRDRWANQPARQREGRVRGESGEWKNWRRIIDTGKNDVGEQERGKR